MSITAVGPSITISQNATATNDEMQLTVWNAPLVPFMLIAAYIALASASLVQARWQDSWPLGLAWFIAHYVTLFAETDSAALATAWQTVRFMMGGAAAIARGVDFVKLAVGLTVCPG